MKASFNTAVAAVVTFLLALLGFSSCKNVCGQEYGTPSATYKIRGTAVDKATEKPVEGLRAVLYGREKEEGQAYYEGETDTVYTDKNGVFDFEFYTFPTDNLHLKIEDVDGEKNGLFTTRTEKLDLKDVEYKGGGNWHKGTAEKDAGTIYMEEAAPEPEEPGEPENPEGK